MKFIKYLLWIGLMQASAFAVGPSYVSYTNWCYQGGLPTMVQGMKSSTLTQTSFPTCQVTVYVHGDGLATLYSDKAGTPLSNPFTATSNGQFEFYVDTTLATEYDVTMTGGTPAPGFPSPVTYADVFIGGGGGGGGGGPGACEIQGANIGDICYFNGTNWIILSGNPSTIRFLSETSGVPAWQNGGILACLGASAGDICYFTGANWLILTGNSGATEYLSETSGMPAWQAIASSTVSVNGSTVSSPNFNGTTPAAQANNINATWQFSGSSVSSEVTYATSSTWGVVKPDNSTITISGGVISAAASGVASIQPQNGGVNYGSPQTGAVVMNFVGCTVSSTFTITCPTGSGTVNSGTASHLAYYATSTTAVSDMGADFAFNTHTLSMGASGILDLHSGATSGFLLSGSFSTGFVFVTTATGAVSSIATSGTKCYPFGGSGGTGCDNPTGGIAFSALTGSTNTTAAMVVGTGASLATSGTGTIAATKVTTARYVGTFPAIATAQTWATMAPYAATFPANFTTPTSTVKCGTNPGGTVVFTLKDVTTSTTLGTVSVSSSCVGTFATTGGTSQSVSEDDYLTVVSGTDATAVNVVIDWKATQ